MKFTRELTARLVIRNVSTNSIRINEASYGEAVALTAEEFIGAWPETPVEELVCDDFHAVFETSPEVVLLGTGPANVFPPRELTFAFARKGVGLEVMDSAAAARTFNVLANEGRRVAAVLYL